MHDLTIPATDGFELAATHFPPEREGREGRFVVIHSATGVRRRYYRRYAAFLAAEGFSVLTFDYRGIGGSRPRNLRRFAATMTEWAERDIAGVLDWVAATHNPERLLVVGHSAGGQLVGLTPGNDRIDGLLTVAAQSGYWRFWPWPRRYLMALLWYGVLPGLATLFGYFPAKRLGLSEDLPGGVAREWARWCRSPHYISDAEGQPIRAGFRAFRSPIRYYSIGDDAYAPRAAVEYLADCYENAPREGRHLEPSEIGARKLGHFGFFREAGRPAWGETAGWLAEV